MRTGVAGLLGALVAVSAAAHAAEDPGVEVFAPQGEVKDVRQVTARFATPMVPFGDPRLVEPFDVDCAEKGSGRWADARHWVFDFERDLPAGVLCRFTLKADAKDLAGNAIAPAAFSFTTGGPAIRETMPWEGYEAVDENQVFILGLDAPATEETVLRHAYCDVSGRAERIPVRVVSGAERKAILERRQDFLDRMARLFVKRGISGGRSVIDVYEVALRNRDYDKLPLVLLACRGRLPAEAEVHLVWGQGIAAPSGVTTSEAQTLAFKVRPAFTAKFTCERVNANAQCIPVLPMSLSFTAPIEVAAAERIQLKNDAGPVWKPKIGDDMRRSGFVDYVAFPAPLPERATFQVVLPEGLKDDAGRTLANARRFPLTVKTDAAPPLAKFAARFGIVEMNAEPALPITLRNVERSLDGKQAGVTGEVAKQPPGVPGRMLRVQSPAEILAWLRRLEAGEARWEEDGYVSRSVFDAADRTRPFTLPKPGGEREFEVVGIPLAGAGLHVVEVVSPKLGKALLKDGAPYYVSAAALVTNLAVHFKWGRESSLVWVTTLDGGEPAADAEVLVQDCGGRVLYRGRTDASGIARVKKALPARETLPSCRHEWDRELFVTARLRNDVSFAFSDWNEGIAPWRFNLRTYGAAGPQIMTTVMDRSLVRAGDTVGMKHFARLHTGGGFALPAARELPVRAVITHQGTDQRWELPLKWDAGAGIAESSFAVPKDAKTGTYSITLAGAKPKGDSENYVRGVTSGSFRVEEFRVPVLRATVQPPALPLINAREATVGLQLAYLSGGGAGYQRVKLRSVLQPKSVAFADYDGVVFANGDVKPGRVEETPRWNFGGFEGEEEDAPASPDPNVRPLKTQVLALDGGGAAAARIEGLPKSDVPQDLAAEMEYADPNGEILTRATRVPLWPSGVLLGVKPDGWALSKDKVKIKVVAVDTAGRPLTGVAVAVDLFEREQFSHRKRLIGGFYAYEYGAEVKRLGDFCQGRTDDKGLLSCEAPVAKSGNMILRARGQDAAGNVTVAKAEAWVAGDGEWWFDVANDDRMDVIPEKKRYEPGETAVFQVRAPFRAAKALVTVEREGVIDGFVKSLTGREPVVEVPLKGHYAPNVFVSVLAVRGRAADVQPTALVDLGKPAYRMGVAEINVGWRTHELRVKVIPDRDGFRVREKAKVAIEVVRAENGAAVKGGEVAVAAVDEALLELLPNDSWRLLDTMMQARPIEVVTATGAMQVVGRRHYGRKALLAGGGGGRQTSRELFDTLLLWKARVKLDERGRAEVEVPLNDSLSAFRIVAIASRGSSWFGSGQATIRTSQDVILLSGLPPLVREQDRYGATFTVRNASTRPLDLELSATVAGAKGEPQGLPVRSVQLAAGEARPVTWEAVAPVNAESLQWSVAARDAGGAGDSLKVTQKVVPAVPVRTFQATLLQLDGTMAMPIARPEDAVPGRGGVSVHLRSRLADELSGVREYMTRYPYTCLEQRASVAVALRDESAWRTLMAALPAYLDRDGLAKYFPAMREGSDTLTSYLLALGHEAGWEIPEAARTRMIGGLTGFVGGSVVRHSALPTADLALRKVAALDAVTRYNPEAEATLASTFSVEPNLWPTSGVIDWLTVARRWTSLPGREGHAARAEEILRSRLDFQGTTMGFSTERSDYLWWLMVSTDVNANRALLALMDEPKWREDLPRMVRGSLGRQQRGHWNTTVANAWGTLAMEKFSTAFEAEPVSGTTRATLAAATRTFDWKQSEKGGALAFDWPREATELALVQEGGGKPWVTVQSRAAVPLKAPFSSGYRVVKSVSHTEGTGGDWRRGDVLRVRLELEAQSDMTWVVVSDPIPAGASILGSGLGGDTQTLTAGERRQGWVWPAFEERTFEAFRAYYRLVPKGKWSVEYTLRLNNPGTFSLPPTRVEAMYAPEMFAELPNGTMTVAP
ncbi:MAG: alpha-2-macroglobulin [Burkholderiales bacterium]|nr:alpha-2-macroglobulin [Burkholderiales bacterium]